MSTYKEINGQKVQSLSSDPPAPFTGQVWYNTTSASLKYNAGALVSSWASGGNLNAGRGDGGGVGTATDALGFGGQIPSSPNYSNLTEAYNGSWTTKPTISTARFQLGQSGTTTSALGFGGYTPGARVVVTESWNGSSWTNGPNMNTARYGLGGVGASNTEALGFGGYTASFAINNTETYNGSWTNSPTMNTGGSGVMGTGPVTATLAAGGSPGGTRTESYNGSWSNLNAMVTSRKNGGMTGTTSDAVIFGGDANITNVYNGTNWTTSATLNSGNPEALGRAGTSSTNALVFGGANGVATTQSLSISGGIRTITTS